MFIIKNQFQNHWIIFTIYLFIIPSILGPACRPHRQGKPKQVVTDWYIEERTLYYGIPVRVLFFPKDEVLGHSIWDYLEQVNVIFNDFTDSSEIGAINKRGLQETIRLSPQLAEAFGKSLEMNRMTNGAFDITLAPLRDLWRKAEQRGKPPASGEVAAVWKACGMEKIALEKESLSVHSKGLRFDFGGIIKGVAVDHVVAMLRNANVRSGLIQIGGETAAFGLSTKGKRHIIGIQHPEIPHDTWARIGDPGTGFSLSTSGNYQNPIIIGDQEYYHILNPETGWPVSNQVKSVSIYFSETGNNWLTDGLSTAATVMGAEKSIALIEKLGGEVLFLVDDQKGAIREIKSEKWDQLNQ